MDSFEASNIVFTKIRDIEPEYVAKKIIGLLLLEDNGEDMIRFAFGPDTQIQSLVEGAKIRLGLTPSQDMQTVDGRMSNPSFVPSSLPIDFLNHNQNLNLDNDLLYNDYMNSRQQQPQLDCERSGKLCQYFRKGYCKNGNKCRYYHSPLYAADNELGSMLLPNSILRLEHDISELLKSKRGSSDPVSTASLPLMYFEKYGRNLQADGYLTESQRHGQTGCNLSSLLARLRSIRLIERPHGQHLVTLAEDALNIRENRGERTNPGPIVHGSRQIYLTFPAASNFTEEDVSDYFSNFGTVEDVRIPWQEQRMFGFVNFADPKTVQIVLSMPNPHYVGDARVLVKAYREKKPANDRNYQENQELRSYLNSYMNPTNMRSERMLSHIENQEKIFEMEKRLSELRIGQMPVGQDAYMGFAAMDDQNPIVNEAAGYSRFWSEGLINYVVDDLSNGSTSQDNTNHLGSYYVDNESQSADLPDSIPTVTPQKKQN